LIESAFLRSSARIHLPDVVRELPGMAAHVGTAEVG
jgi:hypothetical protein